MRHLSRWRILNACYRLARESFFLVRGVGGNAGTGRRERERESVCVCASRIRLEKMKHRVSESADSLLFERSVK